MEKRKIILTTVDDRLLIEATPMDMPLCPDNENFWFCDDCGYGTGLPPGEIIREIFDGKAVITTGCCVKCGSNRFARSMLANK